MSTEPLRRRWRELRARGALAALAARVRRRRARRAAQRARRGGAAAGAALARLEAASGGAAALVGRLAHEANGRLAARRAFLRAGEGPGEDEEALVEQIRAAAQSRLDADAALRKLAAARGADDGGGRLHELALDDEALDALYGSDDAWEAKAEAEEAMSDGDEDDEGEEELDDEAKAFVEELRGAAQQKLDADRAMAKLMAARGTERDLGESSGDDDYNGSEEQGDYDDDSEEEGDYDDDAKEEVRRLVEELKQQKAARAAAAEDGRPLAEQMASCGSPAAAFRELGVCTHRGALSGAQVERCLKLAQRVGKAAEEGRYILSQQRTAGRYDLVVPELAADEFAFAHRDAPWMQVGRELLGGEPAVAYMGVLWTLPSADSQQFHADGRPLFAEGLEEGSPDLPPYAINVFMPLVDVDEANGPTEFIPRSHRQGYPKGPTKPQHVEAKAGDAILFDFRVVHRGAGNAGNKPRPMLYTVLCRPWFRDTVNWPQAVRRYWENCLSPNDTSEKEKRERDDAMEKILRDE